MNVRPMKGGLGACAFAHPPGFGYVAANNHNNISRGKAANEPT
jgi:hypothetical protein